MKKTLAMILALVMVLALSVPCFAVESDANGNKVFTSGELTQMNPISEENAIYYTSEDGISYRNMYFDDLNSAVMALLAGKVDEIADIPQPVAEYIAAHNDAIAWEFPHSYPLMIKLCMAVLKENNEVFDLLSNAISELTESGKLEELKAEYIDAFLESGEEPEAAEMPKFDGAKTIRVAVSGDFPPIDYTMLDGTPAGFNVALLSAIAELAKVNIELVPVSTGARLVALTEDKVDAIFISRDFYFIRKNSELKKFNTDIPDALRITVPYYECPNAQVFLK